MYNRFLTVQFLLQVSARDVDGSTHPSKDGSFQRWDILDPTFRVHMSRPFLRSEWWWSANIRPGWQFPLSRLPKTRLSTSWSTNITLLIMLLWPKPTLRCLHNDTLGQEDSHIYSFAFWKTNKDPPIKKHHNKLHCVKQCCYLQMMFWFLCCPLPLGDKMGHQWANTRKHRSLSKLK